MPPDVEDAVQQPERFAVGQPVPAVPLVQLDMIDCSSAAVRFLYSAQVWLVPVPLVHEKVEPPVLPLLLPLPPPELLPELLPLLLPEPPPLLLPPVQAERQLFCSHWPSDDSAEAHAWFAACIWQLDMLAAEAL